MTDDFCCLRLRLRVGERERESNGINYQLQAYTHYETKGIHRIYIYIYKGMTR